MKRWARLFRLRLRGSRGDGCGRSGSLVHDRRIGLLFLHMIDGVDGVVLWHVLLVLCLVSCAHRRSVVGLNELVRQRGDQVHDGATFGTTEISTLHCISSPSVTSLANCLRKALLQVIEPTAPLDSTGKKLMIASRIVRTILKSTKHHTSPRCLPFFWVE